MNVTANAAGTYTNLIGKDALKTDGGNNPEEATDGITVVPPTDPTVLKEFDPKSIARGQTSRLKITITAAAIRWRL